MTYRLRGATLFRPSEPPFDQARPLILLHSVSQVTMEDGTIEGPLTRGASPQYDPTRAKYHGIQLFSADRITLRNLSIVNVHGDCVDVEGSKATGPSTNVVIKDLACQGTGRQGISTGSADGLRIRRVDFDFIARSAVDLEPGGGDVTRDVVIAGNTFRWIGNFAIAGVGGSSVWDDVAIRRNNHVGCDGQSSEFEECFSRFMFVGNSFDRGPVIVENNTVHGTIYVKHMSGTVEGNVMTSNPKGFSCFATVVDSPGFSVEGNTMPGNIREACGHYLTVEVRGGGSGTVTSSPSGISCGDDCGEAYAQNQRVTLSATAAAGSMFSGWGGDCTGPVPRCIVTIDNTTDVVATFEPLRVPGGFVRFR
jgi:hypothetical protein